MNRRSHYFGLIYAPVLVAQIIVEYVRGMWHEAGKVAESRARY